MKKPFVDKFTDIQESMVALCLEFAEGKAKKIFIFFELRPACLMFNALFLSDGKILYPLELAKGDIDYVWQLLDEGGKDLERLRALCSEYEEEAPVEAKMIYDVKTNFFSANYRYANQIPEVQDGTYISDYVYDAWREELKAKYEK